MIFNKILITNKNELLKYKEKIFELFLKSFDKPMDEKLWQWAYIDNPNGEPIVSLYFDGETLAGHYAVIPIILLHNQKKLKAVLSMTTMVGLPYRRYGIFINQANEVNEKATNLGYQLVCGFPNKKSAPGFKKRLDWILEEDLYVAKFNYSELMQLERQTYPSAICFNTQDKANIEWRLNKPNQEYTQQENNILKKFGNEYDIVFSSGDFSTLEKDGQYNLLLDHNLDKHLDKKEFEYIFGYRIFDQSLSGVSFKKDLIMSDVF